MDGTISKTPHGPLHLTPQAHDVPDWAKYNSDGSLKGVKKTTTSAGYEAKKDQELNLQEFLNMLVRIAFWRANPTFGNFIDKDGDGKKDKEEVVPVAFALSNMLNEIILPRAKRENSAAFRQKEMQDPKLLAVIDVSTCASRNRTSSAMQP